MARDRLEQLSIFLAEDPTDAFTLFALAKEHAKRGDLTVARETYERLISVAPEYTGTYYHLGMLHRKCGRADEATAVFERGIAAARAQRAWKDLSELQDALLDVQGLEE